MQRHSERHIGATKTLSEEGADLAKSRERELLAKLKAKKELGFPKDEAGETKDNLNAEQLLNIVSHFLSYRNPKINAVIEGDPNLKIQREVIIEQISRHEKKIRQNQTEKLFGGTSKRALQE